MREHAGDVIRNILIEQHVENRVNYMLKVLIYCRNLSAVTRLSLQ